MPSICAVKQPNSRLASAGEQPLPRESIRALATILDAVLTVADRKSLPELVGLPSSAGLDRIAGRIPGACKRGAEVKEVAP
jgi:hypothetical protein